TFFGAVFTVLVDADDVIDAAAVTGYADGGGNGGFLRFGQQEIAENGDAGAAVEDEFLAAVGGEVADFDGLRVEGRAFFREAAEEFGHFRGELFLPGFGLFPRAWFEGKLHGRGVMEGVRPGDRI